MKKADESKQPLEGLGMQAAALMLYVTAEH